MDETKASQCIKDVLSYCCAVKEREKNPVDCDKLGKFRVALTLLLESCLSLCTAKGIRAACGMFLVLTET